MREVADRLLEILDQLRSPFGRKVEPYEPEYPTEIPTVKTALIAETTVWVAVVHVWNGASTPTKVRLTDGRDHVWLVRSVQPDDVMILNFLKLLPFKDGITAVASQSGSKIYISGWKELKDVRQP